MPKVSTTLESIARQLGVSRMTVSNAYNRPHKLSPDLRRRILETAEALGYPGPHPVASTLRRGKVGALGFISDDTLPRALTDPHAVQLLQGVAAECEPAGLGLVLVPWSDEPGVAARLVRDALVDAFIFYSDFVGDQRLQGVKRRGLPFVLIDSPRLPGANWVGIDDRAAARAEARFLLDLGHRRFGILSLPLAPDRRAGPAGPERLRTPSGFHVTRERLAGYRAALEQAGVEWASVPIHESPVSAVEPGAAGAAALLDRAPPPTAILAMSDQLAVGALRTARRRGVDVPTELSVVGFDDTPEASLERPALTTVRQPTTHKGVAAARLLLADPVPEAEVIELPTELVIRGSAAGAPGRP